MKIIAAVIVLSQVLLLGACAGRTASYIPPQDIVTLDSTPFHAQAEYQCGPAALATVLGASGVAVTPEQLTPQVYLPQRKGSIQAELVAATRLYDRVPYVLRPDLKTLLDEIDAGTPVLVLQNLGLAALPQWHFAVVIGYDKQTDSLLLRSGTKPLQRMTRRRFEASWERAHRWALVTVKTGKPPATATAIDWLRAASAFEELGNPAAAIESYTAATQRWPEQSLAWQALANARYTLHDLHGAEDALREAVRLAPSAAAYNNLAQVLLERDCPAAATTEMDRADMTADAAAYAAALAGTRSAIVTFKGSTAANCPP